MFHSHLRVSVKVEGGDHTVCCVSSVPFSLQSPNSLEFLVTLAAVAMEMTQSFHPGYLVAVTDEASS